MTAKGMVLKHAMTLTLGVALAGGCGGDDGNPGGGMMQMPAQAALIMGGTVVDFMDGTPVAGATVRALSPSVWFDDSGMPDLAAATKATAVTDASGRFSLGTLNVDDFFVTVILLIGDADASATTLANIAHDTADIAKARMGVMTNDDSYLSLWKDRAYKAMRRSTVDTLQAQFQDVVLLQQGFVLGEVVDAAGMPVDGVGLVKGAGANMTAPLARLRFRDAAGFTGAASMAQAGGQFVVGDSLPLQGLELPQLIGVKDGQMSSGRPGGAITTAGMGFFTRVEWK